MKLHFHGAARGVTGSRHLLETRGGGVLLDCGLYQGHRDEAFRRNRLLGFDPKSVRSVVLSHAHIDHSGALPCLVRAGWKGPIYATPATADLAAIMLQDSAAIQERDVEIVNRREGTSKEPLYTAQDARAAAALLQPVPYHQAFQPADHVTCSFHDAGHMLGSSLVRIESEGKRIVFSGDLGRSSAAPNSSPAPTPSSWKAPTPTASTRLRRTRSAISRPSSARSPAAAARSSSPRSPWAARSTSRTGSSASRAAFRRSRSTSTAPSPPT